MLKTKIDSGDNSIVRGYSGAGLFSKELPLGDTTRVEISNTTVYRTSVTTIETGTDKKIMSYLPLVDPLFLPNPYQLSTTNSSLFRVSELN